MKKKRERRRDGQRQGDPASGPEPPDETENPEHGYANPLSEISRTERRNLLFATVAVIAFVWGSLIPTEIDAFGIKVAPSGRWSLVAIMFGVNVYFFIAFWLYARVDDRAWLIAWTQAQARAWEAMEHAQASGKSTIHEFGSEPPREMPREEHQDIIVWRAWQIGQTVYTERRIFDIYFPLLFAVIAWIVCGVRLFLHPL